MKQKILLVDDEAQITRVLRTALTIQGYDVRAVNDSEEALRVFDEWSPDLVVTDLVMPGIDGIEVCRTIRAKSDTPIIVLSVRDQEQFKVKALDAGADDYVIKPFGIQELTARVRAHLRRAPEKPHDESISVGDFTVDTAAHEVKVRGTALHLTPKEFELLLHFARNSGKIISHRALLTAIWGSQSAQQPEYLRVFVGQLRKKLAADSTREYIQTEPWVGYRFLPDGVPE
jgi:two-component system, OmpR family, KDP operon response regulator KdpE